MIQLGEEIHPPISTPMEWLGTSRDLFEFSLYIYKMKKLNNVLCIPGASLVAQMVKNLLQWRRHRFDPWIVKISWRIPWTEEPRGLQPMGSQRATTKQLTFWLSLCSHKIVSALLGKVYLPILCSHLRGLCFHLAWLIKVISQRR